jgi:hypothetical protein
MSPPIGSIPFYIWSLSDAGDTTRWTTFYVPSLFVGVTDNTAWDGNNYDFYFGEMGNRVFLLLEQHYRKSITLWSCGAGTNQYATEQQQLALFPFTNVAALATTPLKMEFAAGKVRVLLGGTPLVNAATDANGWVTYIGPSASGRVSEPLGDTRFWFSLAGGEKAGPREFVVSDQPLVTTRYTYDGSDVTESSLVVTGKLTLTHDVTLKARSFSAAYPGPSAQTAASFDSLLPELPAESYVSPAYVDLYHATLDGTPALVSMDGPSGTIYGMPLADHRFVMRYPLAATEPTPVTLHRSGIPDLSSNIIWRTIDLGQESHPDSFALRLGESLRLTAGAGETGVVQVVLCTARNEVYRTYEGQPGDEIPVLFDQPGTFTAVAFVNGVSVGSLVASVVYVNFDGPIACQVGFERTKGVEVFGPLDQVFFTNKNDNLNVRVLYPESFGVRLGLKATNRREPVILQARLGSPTGPILAEQKIDAFDVDYGQLTHVVVNGGNSIANSYMTMRPWVPNLYVDYNMFASYSTFPDGSTRYQYNTSDLVKKNVNGKPVIELIVDARTGETQAVLRVDLCIPSGSGPNQNNGYCFQATFDQHSKYGTQIGWVKCNGNGDVFEITKQYWGKDEVDVARSVTISCILGHNPPQDHSVFASTDASSAFFIYDTISCMQWYSQDYDVNKFASIAPGKYHINIDDTQFEVLIVFKVDITHISFNYKTTSATDDALNLRENKDTAITLPEYDETAGRNKPAAYIKAKTVKINVRMKVDPSDITSVKIKGVSTDTGGSLGDATETAVSFVNGVSDEGGDDTATGFMNEKEYVPFSIGTTHPNIIASTEKWKWVATKVETTTLPDVEQETTSGHKVYTVLDEPKSSPWNQTYNDQFNVWCTALDLVCDNNWAGGSASTKDATSGITKKLFDTAFYPVSSSGPQQFELGKLKLSALLANQMAGQMNCEDVAHSVAALGNAVGCKIAKQRYGDNFEQKTAFLCGWAGAQSAAGSIGYHYIARSSDGIFDGTLKFGSFYSFATFALGEGDASYKQLLVASGSPSFGNQEATPVK